jgi:thymidylate synthase
MQQYREMVSHILQYGEARQWRNGHTGISVFDYRMEFDLRKGFPLLGLKFVPFMGPVLGELLGFLRGYTSAADFRKLGCKVWDQNANEEPSWLANPNREGEDDLGRIYGAQWTDWRAPAHFESDPADQFWSPGHKTNQIAELINSLRNDPHGRRHVVSAWNPGELHLMALPPCHMFFQCYVSNDGHLDLKMYQRSADTFLGVPFNIASYAALMIILGKLTGLTPRRLIMDFGDAHLYTDHLEKSTVMISRPHKALPLLECGIDPDQPLESIEPDQFNLVGYEPHPAIKASMAV